MTKVEFLKELERKLSGLPQEDIDNRLEFYGEMIDDRVDEGKSEEEAINDIGSVDSLVEDIAKETPLVKIVKEKITPKRKMTGFEIAMLMVPVPPMNNAFILLPSLLTYIFLQCHQTSALQIHRLCRLPGDQTSSQVLEYLLP